MLTSLHYLFNARRWRRVGGRRPYAALALLIALQLNVKAGDSSKLTVLFVGDRLNEAGHDPAGKAEIIIPALASHGIQIDYTNDVSALNQPTLARYDSLLLYNNIHELPAASEQALIDFVEGGKGLVAVHCASAAFGNSERYTALLGGQFASHGVEVFRPTIIDAQHPAMLGATSIAARDESYLHAKLRDDLRVLMVREHAQGMEPWTWTREQGKGRVFYTAGGHYPEIWRRPEFQKLLENGIRWTTRRQDEDLPAMRYVPARVPRYVEGAAWGSSQEQDTMQAPLPPEESIRHMHLPEGFHAELFAAEPDIVKPIAMAWDERGRLWVVESVDYPNQLSSDPLQNGHDRIVICEDTDHDGRADKFTVFADHLNLPTGLAFANGGVIVAIAPHILFLKDTNGDDVADERRIIYTGFGRSDTHAVLSNLRYGLDNWVYGSVGYSGGAVRVGKTVHELRAGLFRFRANGSAFEVLAGTSNNTWGFGQNEEGDIFCSTANNEHAVHLAIPNRYFEAVRGWHGQGCVGIDDHKRFHPVTGDVRQVDVFGGYTAAAGFEVYTARAYPESFWRDTAFVCEPTGHLVHIDKLIRRGSEFIARDGYNLLASSYAWTAPIAAQVGPDGAVWVLDWYNYIIQHNPVPKGFENGPGNAYVTPLRDKEHGRVYRIVHDPAKLPTARDLRQAKTAALVETLNDDNRFWRLSAQRLLVDQDRKDAIPMLAALITAGTNSLAATHALYALDGLGAFAGAESKMTAVLRAGLTHPAPVVRRAALTILPRKSDSVATILSLGLLKDPDAMVKKDALLALAEMPGVEEAGVAVADFLSNSQNLSDRWLPLAAISAAAQNDLTFLRAVTRIQPPESVAKTLNQAVRVFAEHYARGGPIDSVAGLTALYVPMTAGLSESMIAGLAAGWPMNRPPEMTPQFEHDLSNLLRKLSLSAQLQLASLANRWGVGDKFQADLGEVKKQMLAKATAAGETDDTRIQAARELMSLASDSKTMNDLLAAIEPQTSPELAVGIVDALGQTSLPEVGPALMARWPGLTPRLRQAVLGVLLARTDWSRSLLAGLERGDVSVGDLNVIQVQRLVRGSDASLAERAKKLFASGGRLPNPDRQKVVDRLLPLTRQHGNATQGKQVFQKNCAVCHRFNGEGASIGPDLTGFAGGNREEFLINIIDPNRSVEGNYRQYIIETKDGQSLSGLLTADNKTSVELLDSQGARHLVLRQDVKQITSSPLSLMPEGFEGIPAEDLVSLLDFLTPSERFLPLPLQKIADVSTVQGMFINPDGPERMIFETWGVKSVSGVPFNLIDPRGGSVPNALVLFGPMTPMTSERPKSATLLCNKPAKAVHLLSGISGWGFPATPKGTVSLIVRLHYANGAIEDHSFTNGVHFADYIRRVEVPGAEFAFELRNGAQLRRLVLRPERSDSIENIEFIKGPDNSAPVIMAVTVEAPEKSSGVE